MKEYTLELSSDGELLDIAFDNTFIQINMKDVEELISDLEDMLIIMRAAQND